MLRFHSGSGDLRLVEEGVPLSSYKIEVVNEGVMLATESKSGELNHCLVLVLDIRPIAIAQHQSLT